MTMRVLVPVLAALALMGCGADERAEDTRSSRPDVPEVQETEPSVREGVSDEQVEYMQEFAAAYAGDEDFEECFAERVEGMEGVARSDWPQLAGGLAAECAGTAPDEGPIE